MCHALFLGGSKPLPLVSLAEAVWFGITPLSGRDAPVRRNFPADWHVYYVQSHDGCGCGFHTDEVFPDEDHSYDAQSRRCLAEYLTAVMQEADLALALYDCWEGDQDQPATAHRLATPERIAAELDPVPELTLVTIERPH